jgi:hypothetical protein
MESIVHVYPKVFKSPEVLIHVTIAGNQGLATGLAMVRMGYPLHRRGSRFEKNEQRFTSGLLDWHDPHLAAMPLSRSDVVSPLTHYVECLGYDRQTVINVVQSRQIKNACW